MKIAILGAGAMGSLFGGKLSAVEGCRVLLYDIDRDHMNQIARQGLVIESAGASPALTVHPEATSSPERVRGADVLIVFVKANATAEVAARFSRLAGPAALAVTLQNGLGNEEILRTYFGAARTAAGVTSEGATFLGPGRIRHAGQGSTHLAMSDRNNPRLRPLVSLFNSAGFETHVAEEVDSLIWSKLIVNVGINALTALLGLPNGRLPDLEQARVLMAELVAEAAAVASALGIRLTFADPLESVLQVARRTAANRSSMLQDFDRNRPTEIDMINGAVVREAEKLGIPVPVNRTVTRLIRALETARLERRETAPGGPALP
jgi:2-dehydropantoate 2-reductase